MEADEDHCGYVDEGRHTELYEYWVHYECIKPEEYYYSYLSATLHTLVTLHVVIVIGSLLPSQWLQPPVFLHFATQHYWNLGLHRVVTLQYTSSPSPWC
jgi:hypothetical protein